MEYRERTLNSMHRLLLSLGMLTLWRVPLRGDPSEGDLRQSTAFYPLVGLGVGLLPAAALLLPLPPGPRAALALAVWVVVTAALPLDGWTRCCEALAPAEDGERTRLHRVDALSDSRLGVIGAAGLVLLLLAKWSALSHVPALAPLVAAPLARWGMVHALRTYVPAREDDAGARLAGAVPLWTATWIAIAILAPLTLASTDPSLTALAVATGTCASLIAAAFLVDRFGGVTGAVTGAACEFAELAVLWAFLPW